MSVLLDILRTTGQHRLRYNGRPYPESKLAAIAQRLSGASNSDAALIDSVRSELEVLEAAMRTETEWLDFMQHG
jgi:hypothetical protein